LEFSVERGEFSKIKVIGSRSEDNIAFSEMREVGFGMSLENSPAGFGGKREVLRLDFSCSRNFDYNCRLSEER
jgi:hypothetical protein